MGDDVKVAVLTALLEDAVHMVEAGKPQSLEYCLGYYHGKAAALRSALALEGVTEPAAPEPKAPPALDKPKAKTSKAPAPAPALGRGTRVVVRAIDQTGVIEKYDEDGWYHVRLDDGRTEEYRREEFGLMS